MYLRAPKVQEMTYRQFKSDFLKNEYFLSRHKNASFSATTVAICVFISYWFNLGILSGALIIGAQSVTGINRQGAFRIRLNIAWKAAFVLSFSALLGFIGSQHFLLSLLVAVILAFVFGWCRQMFPLNWPDIIIPSGVLFFLNYTHPMVLVTTYGAIIGLVFEILLGIFIYLKRYYRHKISIAPISEKPPLQDESDKSILGLKEYLFVYSVELALLLITGFFIMQYTTYPHAYWMPLTAIIVLKVGRKTTLKRVLERTLGTLAGCLLGTFLLYLQVNLLIEAIAMVTCIYFFIYYLKYNYALGSVFITTFVLLLLNDKTDGSSMIIVERMIFTVLGGVLAMIISLIFLKKERL